MTEWFTTAQETIRTGVVIAKQNDGRGSFRVVVRSLGDKDGKVYYHGTSQYMANVIYANNGGHPIDPMKAKISDVLASFLPITTEGELMKAVDQLVEKKVDWI